MSGFSRTRVLERVHRLCACREHVANGPDPERAGPVTSQAEGPGRSFGADDYLLAELERLAARPTRDDLLARIHGRKRVTLKTPAAVVIREERHSA